MHRYIAAVLVLVFAHTAKAQEVPATMARTQFVSLLNPAFAVTKLDYNRANLSYTSNGALLASAHVHFPNIYTAVGAFGSKNGDDYTAGVHASYHTIFLNRFHLTAGAMAYANDPFRTDWRGRYGLSLSGGKKRYWIIGANVDQALTCGRLLPGAQVLYNIGLIARRTSLKFVSTLQMISPSQADWMAMPLVMARGIVQGGIGYYHSGSNLQRIVGRISYRKYGWWHVHAGWPLEQKAKSITIECSFQKSF